jgi:hypothetical protein
MENHYSSTFLSFRGKQYYPAEVFFLPVETMPHPTRLEPGTSKLAFPFSNTAYN